LETRHHIIILKYLSILDDILGVISIFQDIFPYLITIKNQILVQVDVGDLYTVSYQINNNFRLFISLFILFLLPYQTPYILIKDRKEI